MRESEREYIFRIWRTTDNSPDTGTEQIYHISTKPQSTVLECLTRLRETNDSSIAFRRSCGSAICGSCAMNINGKNRLACETQLHTLTSATIILRPLPGFPVIRDLIVDMEPFFSSLDEIKPYIIEESVTPLAEEKNISCKHDNGINNLWECNHCGCCTSACRTFSRDKRFLGPAAYLKAQRYNMDPIDKGKQVRNTRCKKEGALFNCSLEFSCTESCPRHLNPADAMHQLKRAIIKECLE